MKKGEGRGRKGKKREVEGKERVREEELGEEREGRIKGTKEGGGGRRDGRGMERGRKRKRLVGKGTAEGP